MSLKTKARKQLELDLWYTKHDGNDGSRGHGQQKGAKQEHEGQSDTLYRRLLTGFNRVARLTQTFYMYSIARINYKH